MEKKQTKARSVGIILVVLILALGFVKLNKYWAPVSVNIFEEYNDIEGRSCIEQLYVEETQWSTVVKGVHFGNDYRSDKFELADTDTVFRIQIRFNHKATEYYKLALRDEDSGISNKISAYVIEYPKGFDVVEQKQVVYKLNYNKTEKLSACSVFSDVYMKFDTVAPQIVVKNHNVRTSNEATNWKIKYNRYKWIDAMQHIIPQKIPTTKTTGRLLLISYDCEPDSVAYKIQNIEGRTVSQGVLDSELLKLPEEENAYTCFLESTWSGEEKEYQGTLITKFNIEINPYHEAGDSNTKRLGIAQMGSQVFINNRDFSAKSVVYEGKDLLPLQRIAEGFPDVLTIDKANSMVSVTGPLDINQYKTSEKKQNIDDWQVYSSEYMLVTKNKKVNCTFYEIDHAVYIESNIINALFRTKLERTPTKINFLPQDGVYVLGAWDNIEDEENAPFGYININGEWVIEPIYNKAGRFYNGLAAVSGKNIDKPIEFLDSETKEEHLEKLLFRSEKFGYIDCHGKTVLLPNYLEAEPFQGGYGVVKILQKNSWGNPTFSTLITLDGDVVSGKESNVYGYGEGVVTVYDHSSGRFGYENVNGNVLATPGFAKARNFSNGVAAVSLQSKWGFINKQGEVTIPMEFFNVRNCSEGLIAFQKSEKGLWGYMDVYGKVVLNETYVNAWPFREGYALVATEEGRCQYINRNGEFIIDEITGEPVSSDIYVDDYGDHYKDFSFSEGFAAVNKKDIWGYMDTGGKWAIIPKYQYAEAIYSGMGKVSDGKTVFYVNCLGERIEGNRP